MLHLSECNLDGHIPANVGDELPNLIYFGCESNPGLTGSLPASLRKCTKLGTLNAWGCQFTAVPASLVQCQLLHTIYLSQNRLSGGVPAFLGKLPNLETVTIFQNPLEVQDGWPYETVGDPLRQGFNTPAQFEAIRKFFANKQ